MFLRNIKITIGIHDEDLHGHKRCRDYVTEKLIEQLMCEIADTVKKHIRHDSYVVVTYEKELGIKINS